MDPNDEVMTADEVAALLSVTPVTVMRWQNTRGLPHVKIGTTTRYRRSAVFAWLSANETPEGNHPERNATMEHIQELQLRAMLAEWGQSVNTTTVNHCKKIAEIRSIPLLEVPHTLLNEELDRLGIAV